jgi:predicted nucleic acid-binding protein
MRLVLDTNVLVAGLRSDGGTSRQVLRRILRGRDVPLLGTTLWLKYESVVYGLNTRTPTTAAERQIVLAAVAARAEWIRIYYTWRPNLSDKGDNHLIELGIAGGGDAIVTWNRRDLASGDLPWPYPLIKTPRDIVERDP